LQRMQHANYQAVLELQGARGGAGTLSSKKAPLDAVKKWG